MKSTTPPTSRENHNKEQGATTVEYAVIVVLIILVILATVLFLVNPADENSLLPRTYTDMGNRIGDFGSANIPTN